jgi:hypothetical protein
MKPGLYFDLPEDEYRADPCNPPSLNQSVAKVFLEKSAWHARAAHPKLGHYDKRAATKQMDRGTIIHALLLGQKLDNVTILSADNYKKKDTQKERDAAKELGHLVILKREYDALIDGLPLIIKNLAEADIVLDGDSEVVAVWDSEIREGEIVSCRSRMDHIKDSGALLIDLKCTDSANPKYIEKHIVDMNYDVQGACEVEAIETLFPDLTGRVRFADVFIECEFPFFVVRADYSESLVARSGSGQKACGRIVYSLTNGVDLPIESWYTRLATR